MKREINIVVTLVRTNDAPDMDVSGNVSEITVVQRYRAELLPEESAQLAINRIDNALLAHGAGVLRSQV